MSLASVPSSVELLVNTRHNSRQDGLENGRYRVHMQVRPNEVDAFGVVNNTIYPQYMLHARTLMLAGLGFTPETLKKEHSILTTTTNMDISFKTPLRPGDMFYAEVSVTSTDGGVSFKASEKVVRLSRDPGAKEVVAAEAVTDTVCLEEKCHRPTQIPAQLLEAMAGAFPQAAAAILGSSSNSS